MAEISAAAEQKAEIKQQVKAKFKELGVDKQIQELVSHKVQPSLAPKSAKNDAITQLKGRGVIDHLVRSLAPTAKPLLRTASEEKRHRHAVHLKIKGVTNLKFYSRKAPDAHEQLVVCGELYGQRFRSAPMPAGVAAAVEAAFSVDLPQSVQTADQVLHQRQLLHLVLLRTFPHLDANGKPILDAERYNLESEVLGTAFYDWREALHSPGQSVECSIGLRISGTGSGTTPPVVVGAIQLEVQEHSMGSCQIDCANIQARLAEELEARAAALQCFRAVTEAAPGWESTHPAAQLLVEGEDGLQHPVCSFVRPLQLGRCLTTLQEACQFVSLIEARLEWDRDVYDGPVGHFWASLHTILSAGLAAPEEKAWLLCSLIQGFGVEAFVACGMHKSSTSEKRLWVVTRPSTEEVLFWDPVSGHRSSPNCQLSTKPCPFTSVNHLFNHRHIYVNSQVRELPMSQISFALEDSSRWTQIGIHAHDLPPSAFHRCDLEKPLVDIAALEAKLEASIKQLLAAERTGSLGTIGTVWDEALAFLLMPALAALEQDAIWGQSRGGFGEEVQQGIKRAVPAGSTFKGCTHHSRCLVAARIVRALVRESNAQDILLTQHPGAVFALRIRVTVYPEHVYSLRLMLASRTPDVLVEPTSKAAGSANPEGP